MAKIYVASSWRNQHQPQVVSFLREQGHEVYDFRHPAGKTGFQWSQIDEDWENWSTDQYRAALEHPIAQAGFKSDFDAMQWADVCVLVLPCGRSAHSEAGWMKGAGKKVIVYQIWEEEPELMYKLFDGVSECKDIVKRAMKWGHKAIAITDHGDVQAFPDANHALSPDDDFKVIYGVEAYLVDDLKDIITDSKGQSLDETFVVFDLETIQTRIFPFPPPWRPPRRLLPAPEPTG